ncbi:hypothetical protein TrVE_jg5743 [Triparma verrucosa]|uniref:Glycerophosphodiester phosphodiesterase n=1 Tax=Triparma verrucosa TaxID=1606542 RepID=A0A9W6ZEA0_9STRA|nr:hypothetical protein TrVE_jg5743 [Triparma verrucosa]
MPSLFNPKVTYASSSSEDALYGDPAYTHKVYCTGSTTALGQWNPNGALPMRLTSEGFWELESGAIELQEECAYKFLVKRGALIVKWEVIPPPYRRYLPLPESGKSEVLDFGKLPDGHPKKKGGKSRWIDRKCLFGPASEVRFVFGAYKHEEAIKLREKYKPKKMGLRLKWGSDAGLKQISPSGGNIQARSVRFVGDDAEDERRRELEHSSKMLTHSSSFFSLFKCHLDLDLIDKHVGLGLNWLELEVVDLDLQGIIATGNIPLSLLTEKNRRMSPDENFDGHQTRKSFRYNLWAHAKSSDERPVGEMFGELTIIRPFVHPNNTMEHCWRNYWTGLEDGRETLDIGHRGLGRSYADVQGQEMAQVRENTIMSFSNAGRAGAEYVELDIMLTKDRIPVVFHDFDIGIKGLRLDSKQKENIGIAISELTLAQLKSLRTTGMDSEEFLLNKGSRTSLANLAALTERGSELDIPTLEELLKKTPRWLGLNVEIKYPMDRTHEWRSYEPFYEVNRYLDDILASLFTHVSDDRRIVFSCFSCDVCSALMCKQMRYPVCFLTGEVVDQVSDFRCTSLESAISFAESEYLLGIVSCSDALFNDSSGSETSDPQKMVGKSCVKRARQKELLLWTWGDKNSYAGYVELQRKWGVDAIICDNIQKLTRKDKKASIFESTFRKKLGEYVDSVQDLNGMNNPNMNGSKEKLTSTSKERKLSRVREQSISLGYLAGKRRGIS